jgi:hypothetical protein
MSTFLTDVVEGQTDPIVHRLLNDGVALLIQGMTVTLILETKDGTAINTSGKVDNLDDGTEPLRGKVRFNPSSSDLLASNSAYYWHWKVTSAGKVAFWPNGQAARLKVFPQGK